MSLEKRQGQLSLRRCAASLFLAADWLLDQLSRGSAAGVVTCCEMPENIFNDTLMPSTALAASQANRPLPFGDPSLCGARGVAGICRAGTLEAFFACPAALRAHAASQVRSDVAHRPQPTLHVRVPFSVAKSKGVTLRPCPFFYARAGPPRLPRGPRSSWPRSSSSILAPHSAG